MDFDRVLGRIYDGFILRDLLGFVAPGSITLIFLGVHFEPHIVRSLWDSSSAWTITIFVVAAYLWAWILQALHYGVFTWVAGRGFLRAHFLHRLSELSRFVGNSNESIETRLAETPLLTQGALEPDLVSAKAMDVTLLKERMKGFPYTERLSALMLLTGNLAIAFVVLAVASILPGYDGSSFSALTLPFFLIACLMYWEYWRLWEARNIQVAIYAVEFERKEKASHPKGGNHARSGVGEE